MQQYLKTERANESDSLLKLPATRWDRLVAVLEVNEPERAIDASHILERARKLRMTDMDLFYLLLLHYQDNVPVVILEVLSLYAMMSTWIEWIEQVQRCFDIKKGKMDSSTWRSAPPSECSSRAAAAMQSDFQSTSRPASTLGGSRHSRLLTGDSFNTNTSDRNNTNTNTNVNNKVLHDSGMRNGLSSGRSHMRNHRSKACRSGDANIHCCFDLGADWEWDGTLDFLRDGRVLSNLVEEALTHCGKLDYLQDDHRAHPEALNRATYDILYPSLADIDRLSKDPAGTKSAGGGSADLKFAAFDPVSYLSTFNHSRLSRDRRGAMPVSKAMRLIERQGRSLAAAEHWVARLNSMCEHFLDWKKAEHHGELFIDIGNSDTLVRPLNADDKRLLYRLHWLAVALYRTVKDFSIIPAPPRMSFILCSDDFTGVPGTSEEDNEISLLVATKCSCLPLNTKLSVTMKNSNTIQLNHPKMVSAPVTLPCTLVQSEAYVYYHEYHVFMPIWCVLQYYVRKYDGIPWRFEPNRQERDREVQVLGKNSSNTRLHVDSSNIDYGVDDNGSGAVFDLTVQSSTVRCRRKKKPELSPVSQQVRNPILVLPVDAETRALPDRQRSTWNSVHAAATARRNRVTAIAPSPDLSLTTPPAATAAANTGAAAASASADASATNDSEEAGRKDGSSASAAMHSSTELQEAIGDDEQLAEPDSAVEIATAVIAPALTISCSQSSRSVVTRETFNNALEDEEYEEEETTAMSTMMQSGRRNILRNFTASVVQESERNGITILSHHFRVSGGPIGKGAFGAVYKALNLDTGRIVAVKQSRVSYDDNTSDLNWREFQTWSMLPRHANVIIFYGASKEVDTHQLLLVLEYASGGSIVQLYRQFRPIPEPLFYDHACGMARGIKHLHDHNVIHGDVKPENVLTRSDGSVAITDFGCSRCSIANPDSGSSSLRRAQKDSSSWQLFGTAAYMAPEVILNEPHFKSDVWAYACTLLQLWLGRSPWSGGARQFLAQDSIPLMFYIANEDVVPYTKEELENTPRWLQRIAQRAFERVVEKRCTMGEIIGILNEYSRAYVQ